MRIGRVISAMAFAGGLLHSGLGLAQDAAAPSLVAPPVIAPAPTPARIVLPQVVVGDEIPAVARTLTFFLIDFRVEGEFEELAKARRDLAAELVGRRITVAEVFEFAAALQAAYVRAGFPLVRVVVPPQELEDRARVRIRVVDGFIERIESASLPERVRARVEAVVASLIGQRRISRFEIERRLLLAGDTPGLRLNATFAPGQEIGGSVLIVSGVHRLFSAHLYVDNAVPQTFGGMQIASLLAVNSLFGQGEQFLFSSSGYPDRDFYSSSPTRRYLSATFRTPLGTDGWTFDLSGTQGRTTPRAPAAAATEGNLTQARVGLAYDAVKHRDAELTLGVRLDATDEQIDSLLFSPPVPLSLDRLRVLRLGASGVWRGWDTGTTVSGTVTLSRGLDALGARRAADATPLLPLSRQGADAVFTKLDGSLIVTQSLPLDSFFTLFAHGQTGFGEALLTSEQFSMAGAQRLSGFRAGALSGDHAWIVRGELGRPIVPAGMPMAAFTPYLFAAVGERYLENPTALEQARVRADNYGLGARLEFAETGDLPISVSAFVEASHRRSNDRTIADGSHRGWRVFAGGLIRY